MYPNVSMFNEKRGKGGREKNSFLSSPRPSPPILLVSLIVFHRKRTTDLVNLLKSIDGLNEDKRISQLIPKGKIQAEGSTAIGIRCTRFWNYVELFWNSLDNAPISIVFYLEMKVEVEVGVHDIRLRLTPRFKPIICKKDKQRVQVE